ncbi:MAG: hypothetical protein KF760_19815 [Candidatus Eremiobacteraeota bacterium]|nr:hypothetical protein [Candidatus Eremiobacteraeota bacterium]MCW5869157.1 hypothetical protein [Candidatus Eremiobacteraeota bacterium]
MADHWLREQIVRVEDSLRQETRKLSVHLLPSLDREVVALAQRRTGLSFLLPVLFDILEAERQQIVERRQHLESLPEFALSVSESQRLAQAEIKRIRDHQAALVPLIRQCHGHPRFALLLRLGYGTGRYATPFWRLSFYADRRAAEELCRRTGKKNFAALLRDYETAIDSYETLNGRLDSLKSAPPPARLEWEQRGRQLEELARTQLVTQQARIQLALFRGGPIWRTLEKSGLEPELAQLVESAGLLRDQLEELRRQRAGG